jgi:cytochrome c peroxidase
MLLSSKSISENQIDEFGIKNALASYIRSLSTYDSKFDEFMQERKNLIWMKLQVLIYSLERQNVLPVILFH